VLHLNLEGVGTNHIELHRLICTIICVP